MGIFNSLANGLRSALGLEKAARSSGVASVVTDLPLWNQFTRIGGGVTPAQVSTFIRLADDGRPDRLIDLANESRQKDGHLHGILQSRELAVQGLDWELFFPDQDPESTYGERQKKFVEGALRTNEPFHRMLAHMSGAFYPGFAVSEILWDSSTGQSLPRDFKNIDARRFGFRRSDGRLIFRDDPASPKEIDFKSVPNKFVCSQPRINGDVEVREGLMRPLVWAAMFRNWSLADWLKLGEIAWKPQRIASYDRTQFAEEKDVNDLISILRALTSNGVAAIPNTVEIGTEWPQGSGGQGKGNHESLRDHVGRDMSKAVLGQTETTEASASSGYAQAKVGERKEDMILKSDVRNLSMVVTRDVIAPMVALNFGDTAPIPYFRLIVKDNVNLKAFAEGIDKLAGPNVRLRLAANWVRKQVGAPTPKDDEEVVGVEPPDPETVPEATPKEPAEE